MELVPKPKASAPVWVHFGFEPNEHGKPADENKPVCRICFERVSASGGNTSNLLQHVRKYHPSQFQNIQPSKRKRENDEAASPASKQPRIALSLDKCRPYDKSSARSQQLTRAVTQYLAGGIVPLYTVESDFFIAMLGQFDSKYKLPGRKYFSETAIPGLYNDVRQFVSDDLKSVEYFSCTTDMWSSKGMVPYLGLTVHFIDSNWNLKSYALETLYFPDNHTADNIGEALKECLQVWGLDSSKLVSMTTDNGSNIKKALRDLSWPNLSCFGHNLHLAVNSALSDKRVTRVLGHCRSIVSTFTTSWKKRRELTEAQVSLDLPQHQLITDCPTRWGAKFDMIKRIVEQEAALRRVLSADRKTTHLNMSWQDSQVLEAVCAALQTVGDFTDILSLEKYVSVSALMPLLSLLDGDLLDIQSDEHSLTSHMKETIKTSMKTRYKDIKLNELLSRSTFLDPKFKTQYLTCDQLEAVKSHFLSDDTESCVRVNNAETCEDVSHVTPKKKTLASLFAKSVNKENCNNSEANSGLESEIDGYILTAKLEHEGNTLHWWKSHAETFPNLAKYARKYLCVPATSCPSERLFSKSGQIVSAKRTCLKPEKVNQLTFLAANLDKFNKK